MDIKYYQVLVLIDTVCPVEGMHHCNNCSFSIYPSFMTCHKEVKIVHMLYDSLHHPPIYLSSINGSDGVNDVPFVTGQMVINCKIVVQNI